MADYGFQSTQNGGPAPGSGRERGCRQTCDRAPFSRTRRLINACGAFWCASKGARPISAVAAPAISRLFRHRALRKTPCYARHRREMVHVRFGSLADTSRRPADVRFTPKQTFAGVSASPLSAISGLVHPYFAIRLMALTRWPPSVSWARTRRRNSLIASAKS